MSLQDRRERFRRAVGAFFRRLTRQTDENQTTAVNDEPKKHICGEILKDYCDNSMVHGFRYFTASNHHWIGRVWWVAVVVTSLVFGGIVIHNTWTDWNENPVIISFNDKITPVDSIPFPAFTICPTKKFLKEKVEIAKIKAVLKEPSKANLLSFEDLSANELSQMNAILQTCLLPHRIPADLVIPSNPSIYETIEDIMHGIDVPIVYNMTWHLQPDRSKLKKTFTEEGLCYTFNSLNSHEIYADGISPELLFVRDNPNATHWNRENGYLSNVHKKADYPYRSFTSDLILDSMVYFLTVIDNSDKFCSSLPAGIHVSVHSPDELPQSRNNFIHIPPEQAAVIFITPNVITTSSGLRSYDPHKRGCYFQSEHRLRFFRSYSEQKCQSECLTDFTRTKCDCVHFAMPRDKNTKVCTALEMECYLAAKQQFDQHHIVKQCDCLPDCFSISYDAEVSPIPYLNYLYSDEEMMDFWKFNFKDYGFHMRTPFSMSFKQNHFVSIDRSESSTMSQFISDCGSLLGLFMGISALSIVELIYYFTLRLFFNWKQQKKVHPIEPDQTINPPIPQGILKDYCTNSTVHGLRYFTEPKRHRVERAWWAVAVATAIVVCGIIIQNIWTNWNENPVIVSFDDKLTPIDQVPFPAVTICPTKKFILPHVDMDKLYAVIASNYTTLDSLSPEEISQLDAIIQTVKIINQFPPNFTIPSNKMIYDTMRNITLGEEYTIQSVNWLDQLNQFRFKPLFTENGLCYTFNSINSREMYTDVVKPEMLTVCDNPTSMHWNRDDGYRSNVNGSDVYPRRVYSSDVFDTLIVRLGIVIDYYSDWDGLPPGFKISLNAPDELPQMRKDFFYIPSEHDAYISIRPETVTTSNGLRSYDPHKRGCYFESERQLHFFKSYSQQKCQLECWTNFSTKECGCAHFSLPQEKHTRICTTVDIFPMVDVLLQFSYEFAINQCDCLPDCTSIIYHYEVSKVPHHYYEDAEVKTNKILYDEFG